MSRTTHVGRRLVALAVLAAAILAVAAAPAFGHRGSGTSVVTAADCERGTITRNGRTLSREECRRLIGQRIRTSATGFNVWMVGAAGVVLLGGGALLLRRRRPDGSVLPA